MSEYLCPHCKNPIYDDEALLCHFCGESLGRASNGLIGQIRYGHNKALWFFAAFAVLIGLVFLFLR